MQSKVVSMLSWRNLTQAKSRCKRWNSMSLKSPAALLGAQVLRVPVTAQPLPIGLARDVAMQAAMHRVILHRKGPGYLHHTGLGQDVRAMITSSGVRCGRQFRHIAPNAQSHVHRPQVTHTHTHTFTFYVHTSLTEAHSPRNFHPAGAKNPGSLWSSPTEPCTRQASRRTY